jgi:hypothetical protein
MTLDALRMAAQAFRRNPYPFAATGVIALALNMLGLIHPVLALVVSIGLLPMLYTGLGTLAMAEPGLRFTQALRLALSAWPRFGSLSLLMFNLLFFFSSVLGLALTSMFGDQLTTLAEFNQNNPEGFAQAVLTQINWGQSAFGLAALALFVLGALTLVWMAPLALVHHNLGFVSAPRWAFRVGRTHFTQLLPAVLVWIVLSVASGALLGLNILLWPFTALFHFFCFHQLGKQGA